jgi:hypothetical protein
VAVSLVDENNGIVLLRSYHHRELFPLRYTYVLERGKGDGERKERGKSASYIRSHMPLFVKRNMCGIKYCIYSLPVSEDISDKKSEHRVVAAGPGRLQDRGCTE